MSQSELLPVVRPNHSLWAELESPLWQRIAGPAQAAGLAVQPVGVFPIPRRPVVQQTPLGLWFLAADYRDDPGLLQDGRIAVPRDQLARLSALRDAGVDPDVIWIGHQLPSTWQSGDPIPVLVPDAPRYRELDMRLERGILNGLEALGQFAGVVARAGTVALTAGLATLAGAAAIGTDPFVLGGIRHPIEPVAAWAVLAKWNWE